MLLVLLSIIMSKKYFRIVLFAISGLSLFIFVIWLGRPDKLGLSRCERLTGLDQLDQYVKDEKFVWAWNPFEIRFRYTLKDGVFDDFKKYTLSHNFDLWDKGGGSYNSFYEESSSSDPLYYSSNKGGGQDLWKIYYRPRTNELHILYYNLR